MSGLYVGIMSGTSLDGIDIALTEIAHDQQARLVAARCLPFPDSLKADLLALCAPGNDEIRRSGLTGLAWARLAAEGVKQLLADHHVDTHQVIAIGSHGQTVRHHPELGFSLQIGAPALLAELTGIDVITDFRSRDIAAGGEGAPLVPAFHHWLLSHPGHTRTLVNVGGFANLTIMRPGQAVLGFDSGPGNILLDYWINRATGQAYDNNGDWGRSGNCQPDLLAALLDDPYFQRSGPKSTGREYFNGQWLDQKLATVPATMRAQDVQATLVELTALTVARAVDLLASDSQAIYLCGGGARNGLLMERLQQFLTSVPVTTTAVLGVDPDWMEAMAFAWLAWCYKNKLPGNLPAVTGAAGLRILGACYPAQ